MLIDFRRGDHLLVFDSNEIQHLHRVQSIASTSPTFTVFQHWSEGGSLWHRTEIAPIVHPVCLLESDPRFPAESHTDSESFPEVADRRVVRTSVSTYLAIGFAPDEVAGHRKRHWPFLNLWVRYFPRGEGSLSCLFLNTSRSCFLCNIGAP